MGGNRQKVIPDQGNGDISVEYKNVDLDTII